MKFKMRCGIKSLKNDFFKRKNLQKSEGFNVLF